MRSVLVDIPDELRGPMKNGAPRGGVLDPIRRMRRDLIVRLYLEHNMTLAEVGTELGISPGQVQRSLKLLQVPRRRRGVRTTASTPV